MTKREIELRIKLIKDRLTLAQIYKDDFIKELGIRGYQNFINQELENLKYYLNQLNQ